MQDVAWDVCQRCFAALGCSLCQDVAALMGSLGVPVLWVLVTALHLKRWKDDSLPWLCHQALWSNMSVVFDVLASALHALTTYSKQSFFHV